MVQKMEHINVTGNVADINAFIEQYILDYNIHFEDAVKELVHEKTIKSMRAENPYAEARGKANKIVAELALKSAQSEMELPKAIDIIERAYNSMENISAELDARKKRALQYQEVIDAYSPYTNLPVDIKKLASLDYIEFGFGKMPITSFKQFEAFLYKDPELLFLLGARDQDFQWGIYFTPRFMIDKIEPIFSSLAFQKSDPPFSFDGEELEGNPKDICELFKVARAKIEKEILQTSKNITAEYLNDASLNITKSDIARAAGKIEELYKSFDIIKLAAKTKNDFFIFVGWMEERDARRLEQEISPDDRFVFISGDESPAIVSSPPIKLRNNFLARPFEFLTKMYGLPSYGEIDPTILLAATYTILFGIMFADAGQGAALAALGFYLRRKKGLALGSIISVVGVSSIFFGLLFGSVFGYEFHSVAISPAESENSAAFLIFAIASGIGLILTSMLINLINAAKKNKIKEYLFEPNGAAGIIFYVSSIIIIYLAAIKKVSVPAPFILIFLVTPILAAAFKKPLGALIGKTRQPQEKESAGMVIVEAFIEIFEIILGYFTNTVSFVRVGAFILSHVAMMSVVWKLSESVSGRNIFVLILGNILATAIEGLIVGIQVLRLCYYEMFSRFYEGAGRPFRSYKEI